MVRLKKKLQSGTLIETLVSLTLIIILIGCSFAALTSISGSTLNRAKVCASHVIKAKLSNDYYTVNSDTANTFYDGFILVEELIPRTEDSLLRTLTLEAITPQGRVIYQAKRIVISD